MYYTQRPWKWLQNSNKPRRIKAVFRTIWTARARHWPRQPKNFQAAGQHTRPRALNFATLSGMFATDVQLMKSFASKQRRLCIEHLKSSARPRRYKKAWRHTGSELDVLQMSTPRQRWHWLFGSSPASRSQSHALPDMWRVTRSSI